MVEFDDARVGGEHCFEDELFVGDVVVHVVACLFFTYQEFSIAFPLHDPDFALAALADETELFVGFGALVATDHGFTDRGRVLPSGQVLVVTIRHAVCVRVRLLKLAV